MRLTALIAAALVALAAPSGAGAYELTTSANTPIVTIGIPVTLSVAADHDSQYVLDVISYRTGDVVFETAGSSFEPVPSADDPQTAASYAVAVRWHGHDERHHRVRRGRYALVLSTPFGTAWSNVVVAWPTRSPR